MAFGHCYDRMGDCLYVGETSLISLQCFYTLFTTFVDQVGANILGNKKLKYRLQLPKLLSGISKILYFNSFLLMTRFSNLSVCSLIVKHKQYKISRSVRLREWIVIFLPPWIADLLYPKKKTFESTILQRLVKQSLKSASVSLQEVRLLSTTTSVSKNVRDPQTNRGTTFYLFSCVSEH